MTADHDDAGLRQTIAAVADHVRKALHHTPHDRQPLPLAIGPAAPTRRRRAARASAMALAGFACALPVAHALMCYPFPYCYGGPSADWNRGNPFEIFSTEDLTPEFGPLPGDTTPRVSARSAGNDPLTFAPSGTGLAAADLHSNTRELDPGLCLDINLAIQDVFDNLNTYSQFFAPPHECIHNFGPAENYVNNWMSPEFYITDWEPPEDDFGTNLPVNNLTNQLENNIAQTDSLFASNQSSPNNPSTMLNNNIAQTTELFNLTRPSPNDPSTMLDNNMAQTDALFGFSGPSRIGPTNNVAPMPPPRPVAGSGDSSSISFFAAGDPINPATGNNFQLQRDYSALGPLPIRFWRYYNSQPSSSGNAPSELGANWSSSYDSRIALVSGQALVVRPDGQSLLFTNPTGTGWVSSDPTVRGILQSASDSLGNIVSWTYTTADGLTEAYDANGRLISIANRAGLAQTLAYDVNGNLASVTDPFGHQMTFSYDPQGRLMEATDPGGGVYRYGYDQNGNLVAVTYPDGATRQYLYEDSQYPNALTGIIDEDGARYATWSYDGQGRAVSSQLAGGAQAVSISYNPDGSSSVTDARGTTRLHQFITLSSGAVRPVADAVTSCALGCNTVSTSATYDGDGFLTSTTDPDGNVTDLTFNSQDLLVARTEAAGTPLARTVNVAWNPTFQRLAEIDFPDRSIRYQYDEHGNRISKTVATGGVSRTWTYAYDPRGLLTQITGPRTDVPQVWHFSYDPQGNLSSVTDPLGHIVRYLSYDASGHPLTIVDQNGVHVDFTYDARGRVLTRTISGRTWAYQRDAAGQITGIMYPNGLSESLTYDAAHRLTDVVNNLGIHWHRTLDAAGDVTGIELLDSSGEVVRARSYTVDGLGRIVSSTDAMGQAQSIAYDNDGDPTAVTDPTGKITQIGYDALRRPTVLTDAAGGTTTFQFNAYNEPTEVVAPNGAVTQFAYDSFGNLLKEVSPDAGTTAITYFASGLPQSVTDARGITAKFRFDALDRITRVSYRQPWHRDDPLRGEDGHGAVDDDDAEARTGDVSLVYDDGPGCTFGVGRLCMRRDDSGAERYAYDQFGNITHQTDIGQGSAYAVRYRYDSGHQLTQVTYPDGRVLDYSRDLLERITSIRSTVDGKTTPVLSAVKYRADGLPASLTFGNGLEEGRSYDADGRLEGQLLGPADARAYSYDADGNVVAREDSAESDRFGYDALNRLTTEERSAGTKTFADEFSYDPDGNRLSATRDGDTQTLLYAPDSNRLVQAGGTAVTLDVAGDTVADQGGERRFFYGLADHLQRITMDGQTVASYRYNTSGERVEKSTWRGVTSFRYDIFGRLLAETTFGGARPGKDYVWLGGVPVAQINGATRGDRDDSADRDEGDAGITYIQADGSGTPRVATDSAQRVVWRWDGEAFGETQPALSATSAPRVTINLRYPGQYYDQESGLFYNGARYYDPRLGRYIASDPTGVLGGIDDYGYADGNPLAFSNPLGLR